MSCEVMPQGWCKLVFAHMQTFTRNNNFKRLLQQSYQKLPDDNIMLDGRIKTHDSGVAGVKFLWEMSHKMTQFAMAHKKNIINDMHIELGHFLEDITSDTSESMGIKVAGALKPCKDCALGQAKKAE